MVIIDGERQRSRRIDRQGDDLLFVNGNLSHQLTGREIPNVKNPLLTASNEPLAVFADRTGSQCFFVNRRQIHRISAVLQIPNFGAPSRADRDHSFAAG